jgi:hypothetical protein
MRTDQQAQNYSMLGPNADADDVLVPLLSDIRNVHMVQTDTIGQHTRGRPMPQQDNYHNDQDRLKDVWLQEGVKDGKILTRITPFNKWLEEHDMPIDIAMRLIKQKYRVTSVRMTVGAGVWWMTTTRQTRCYLMEPFKKPTPPDDQRS